MPFTDGPLSQTSSGETIRPDDPGYTERRRTRLISGSPALVLVPRNERDVCAAVRYGRHSGMEVAVRGGGHSFAGFGTTDTGLVIDLSRLDQVTIIDTDRRIVRVGGGATWGQVSDALSPHGLAISSGDTRSVGVGGLTLSGGIGWKVRKYGLALDQLVAAEVVSADGEVRRASEDERPDLFWALRGGGGNFGIVTAFEFVAHESTDVFFGKLTFPTSDAHQVLNGWARYLRHAPRALTSIANLANPLTGGADAPVELHVCWDGGDATKAEEALAPLRALGTVLEDSVERRPFASVLEEGGSLPEGFRIDTRSGFVKSRWTPTVLNRLVEIAASGTSPFISIRALGGAIRDVGNGATAYAHRSAELMVVTIAGGPTAAVEAGRARRAELWHRLTPFLSGAYANFLDSATREDVDAVYPPRYYSELAAIKQRYDPTNMFSLNHNILPAEGTADSVCA